MAFPRGDGRTGGAGGACEITNAYAFQERRSPFACIFPCCLRGALPGTFVGPRSGGTWASLPVSNSSYTFGCQIYGPTRFPSVQMTYTKHRHTDTHAYTVTAALHQEYGRRHTDHDDDADAELMLLM